MGLRALAAWQWDGYPEFPQSRRNLLVHIVAVPLFMLGNMLVVAGAIALAWWLALTGVMLSAVAFGIQGAGHKGEPVRPVPFSGAGNFIGRLLLEQWVTFPRFVLSGGWSRNLHGHRTEADGARAGAQLKA